MGFGIFTFELFPGVQKKVWRCLTDNLLHTKNVVTESACLEFFFYLSHDNEDNNTIASYKNALQELLVFDIVPSPVWSGLLRSFFFLKESCSFLFSA